MQDLMRDIKDLKGAKDPTEIGVVTKLKPFAFEINGVEYSSKDFAMYLPAIDRVRQFEDIKVETVDPNPHLSQRTNKGKAFVDVGDLEFVPDLYPRPFLVGDLIDVTDRGNSFVIHGRLVKLGEEKEIYKPTHREV